MNNNKYIVQLDGLRFFAVLMVMIAHWLQWLWVKPFLTNFPFVHGVILFFVLSGFLITKILLTNKDDSISANISKQHLLKNFYIRRFLRIFPIYYLLLFFLLSIDYKNTKELLPWLLSYSSNIYQSIYNIPIGNFNHFWSLGVEEQFYLFWPCLILFCKSKKVLTAIIVTITGAILIKFYFFFFIGKWMATAFFTINCMHALGIGALLSYLVLYKRNIIEIISKPIWLYLALFFYIVLFFIQYKFKLNWYKEVIDEFAFALLSSLIILRASTNGFKWGFKYILENKFIVYAGKISYGLYVYHLFMPDLFYYIEPKIGLSVNNKYTAFVCFFLLTFLVAHFSWILIEKPINNLKSKVPYLK